MCGRFVVSQKVDDLTAVFDAENDFDDWRPSYSLAPTDTVPIVRERADRETGEFVRRLEPAVWNFHQAGYDTQAILREYPRLTAIDIRNAIAYEHERRHLEAS